MENFNQKYPNKQIEYYRNLRDVLSDLKQYDARVKYNFLVEKISEPYAEIQ